MSAELTVIGSSVIDVRNGGERQGGGCPVFVQAALADLDVRAHVITHFCLDDADLVGSPVVDSAHTYTILPAETTSVFSMSYQGDVRSMAIAVLGAPWTIAELAMCDIETEWVHLAPVYAGEFGTNVVDWLHLRGHRISLDGQGLVRRPYVGPLVLGDYWESAPLNAVSVLKLATEEEAALGRGPGELGVDEVVVTDGSRGARLWWRGVPMSVEPVAPVETDDATGAGDMFMVAYVARRALGADPVEACEGAGRRVSAVLTARERAGDQ